MNSRTLNALLEWDKALRWLVPGESVPSRLGAVSLLVTDQLCYSLLSYIIFTFKVILVSKSKLA